MALGRSWLNLPPPPTLFSHSKFPHRFLLVGQIPSSGWENGTQGTVHPLSWDSNPIFRGVYATIAWHKIWSYGLWIWVMDFRYPDQLCPKKPGSCHGLKSKINYWELLLALLNDTAEWAVLSPILKFKSNYNRNKVPNKCCFCLLVVLSYKGTILSNAPCPF